ncbi:MAG: M14 family metallopeptidase [Nannocystaceae bacterium]
MTLAPYAPPAKWGREFEDLAARVGGEILDYGASVEGRTLRALRIPGTRGGLPRALCAANIHGVEVIGTHVVLTLLRRLAAGDPEVAWIRDRVELLLLPSLNPDAQERTFAREGHGALPELRANHRGVDLNRNYPLPFGARPSRLPGAGSSRPGDATYRGEAPLSEPETRALADLLAELRPRVSANLHSFMGTLIPASVRDRPSFRAYAGLCRAFRAAQARTRYRRLSSRIFDVYTGEQEDYQHHVLDGWAVCVELFSIFQSYGQHLRAPSLFWRFNPRDPDRLAAHDLPGILALLRAGADLPAPSALAGANALPGR